MALIAVNEGVIVLGEGLTSVQEGSINLGSVGGLSLALFRRKIERDKMIFTGKYNQAKTVRFSLHQLDGINFESGATFEAGDITLMSNEGAEANTTNLPVDEGIGYSLLLTAAEMSMARGKVYIVDQTDPKVWLDIDIDIETYGHADAEHQYDLDTANLTASDVTTDMDANSNDFTTIIANQAVIDGRMTAPRPEPGQGTPAASASMLVKVDHLYKRAINKVDTDGITENYYNNAGGVVDHKRAVSDLVGVTTKENVVSGP